MQTAQPFSVAMSVYGKDDANQFIAAMQSVLNQTIKPSQIVLVVDGPVPQELHNTIEKLAGTEPILEPIYLPENKGLGNALKVALEHCRHELIARMDSDDIAVPDRFEKQLACFASNRTLSVVGGAIDEFIDSPDCPIGRRTVPLANKDIKQYLKKRCPLNHVTVMFKKSDVMACGGYIDWFWNEDYYLWIRMAENGAVFYNLPDVLVKVRVGADMYKRRGGYRYFKSEEGLQRYMLKHHYIGLFTYLYNTLIRLVIQVLMPSSLRAFVFKKFARKEVKNA